MSDVKPVAWQRFDEIGEYDSYMGSVEEGDYVKYDDALATVTALQAEIEALRKDAERLDWVQRNLLSADLSRVRVSTRQDAACAHHCVAS